MKSNHQVGLDILNLNILFSSMININIFFNFVKTLNKDYMFKVCLSIFIEIQASSQSTLQLLSRL
jgi:hypothetical protein